jgi:hypothetical protein
LRDNGRLMSGATTLRIRWRANALDLCSIFNSIAIIRCDLKRCKYIATTTTTTTTESYSTALALLANGSERPARCAHSMPNDGVATLLTDDTTYRTANLKE